MADFEHAALDTGRAGKFPIDSKYQSDIIAIALRRERLYDTA
jgi:hypothetical protein